MHTDDRNIRTSAAPMFAVSTLVAERQWELI